MVGEEEKEKTVNDNVLLDKTRKEERKKKEHEDMRQIMQKEKKNPAQKNLKDDDNTFASRLTHVWKRSGMSVTSGAAPARKYDVA